MIEILKKNIRLICDLHNLNVLESRRVLYDEWGSSMNNARSGMLKLRIGVEKPSAERVEHHHSVAPIFMNTLFTIFVFQFRMRNRWKSIQKFI